MSFTCPLYYMLSISPYIFFLLLCRLEYSESNLLDIDIKREKKRHSMSFTILSFTFFFSFFFSFFSSFFSLIIYPSRKLFILLASYLSFSQAIYPSRKANLVYHRYTFMSFFPPSLPALLKHSWLFSYSCYYHFYPFLVSCFLFFLLRVQCVCLTMRL
jgi:hypothetical protein